MKQFLLAGTSSGVGKTTVTLAVLQALILKGYKVQPYKVGPDYIDTAYHSRISQRASRNLDMFMIPDVEALRGTYQEGWLQADIALVEGVMGLFDGLGTDRDCASSAAVAKRLGIPVILIVDGKSTSTSAAAVVKGFAEFDPDVAIVGVIINRVASQQHFELIKGAIERYTNVEVFGYLKKEDSFILPSRHLGLVPQEEMAELDQLFLDLGRRALETIAIDRILACCDSDIRPASLPFSTSVSLPLRLGYAQDEAFHFYYADNLSWLEKVGATLVPFSPLRDTRLPEADAYYFGGGFPEVFADQLAENVSFRQSVLEAHQAGKPIYAECGGLMYLGEFLEVEGALHSMVGIFQGVSRMTKRLKRFGYCRAVCKEDTLFGPKGTIVLGHEFHHSIFETQEQPVLHLEKWRDGERVASWEGGYQKGNSFASYLHVHFYQSENLFYQWLHRLRRD